MPVFGTGERRTDGQVNSQISTRPTFLLPNEVSNLALWFDAADTSTIRTNISSLNQWQSKTSISTVMSNAQGLLGATWRSTTQNGLPVIRFNSSNSFMSSVSLNYPSSNFTTSNETTMFLAYNPTNNGIAFGVVDSASRGGGGTRLHPQSGQSWFFGNIFPLPNNARLEYSYPVNTGFKVETYLGRQSTLSFRNNGATFATSTMLTGLSFPNQNNLVFMGGLSYTARVFTQDVGEALLFNRGLTDPEIIGIESYLAGKWGVRTTLPFNHPARVVGPPLLGYRLLSYPTLAASNAALWFDTMDTASMRGLTTQRFPPNNLDFSDLIFDKASGSNSGTSRWPVYDMFGWNYKPTLKFIAFNPVNARFSGTPPFFLGSSLSMFLAVNAQRTPFGSNIITIGEDQNTPGSRGLSVYFTTTSTIGVQRGVNLVSSFYVTGSNILISAFVNGAPSTVGGLPPSTTSLFFNGSLVASTPTPSNLSSFRFINYCLGGNNNFQNFEGNISEWNVFYRTLSTEERNAMHAQMLPKWSLPSNEPITYINSLPTTTGLFGWYDAYDEKTVLRNSSNNVSMWLDKSGQNNHMSTNLLTFGSNTGSNIYYSSISISTNQYPSLFFPSTFAFMQTSTLITNESFSSFTMIAVKRGTKLPDGPHPHSVAFFSTLNVLETGGAFIGATFDSLYNVFNFNPIFSDNFRRLHINTFIGNVGPTTIETVSSTSAISFLNGRNSFVSGGYNYQGMLEPRFVRLMASPFNNRFDGDVRADAGFLAEVLLYNRVLNSNEFINVHTYLQNKWGVSTVVSNVPVTRGLNLWLDCYDPLVMTFSTNTTQVQQWRDKSLCNFHFSNALNNSLIRLPTYEINPINSLYGLSFSNGGTTNNFFTSLYNSNFTYPQTRETTLFVTYTNSNIVNQGFYGTVFSMILNNQVLFNSANGLAVAVNNGTNGVAMVRSSISIYTNGIPNSANRVTVATVMFNSSLTTLQDTPDIPTNAFGVGRNGVIGITNTSSFITSLGNLTAQNFLVNQAILGSRGVPGDTQWYFNGFIHEILQYNRSLTFSERQQVEAYLMTKWNV